MKTHELKTLADYFGAVLDGRKTFELRRDDRGFEVGDLLHLREYDAECQTYSGRECYRRVTYILRAIEIADGFVVLGLAYEIAVPGEPRFLGYGHPDRVRRILAAAPGGKHLGNVAIFAADLTK